MNIEKILKDNKKSLTKERKDIFSYMESKHLFSSNDLISAFSSMGRASIFRTLNLFLEIGILRRVFVGKRGDSYELNKENHHHEHMKCEKCSKFINFESENICNLLFEEAKKVGFLVKEHSVNIIGNCSNCL